jgi:hypothetical protein
MYIGEANAAMCKSDGVAIANRSEAVKDRLARADEALAEALHIAQQIIDKIQIPQEKRSDVPAPTPVDLNSACLIVADKAAMLRGMLAHIDQIIFG